MKSPIITKVSKKELTVVPDIFSANSEFDVKVINGSKKFTSFQLELIAPGLEDESDEKWYKIEPEICTKNPPGSETDFHVVITKPPIPAYNKTVDLELKTLSIEDENLSNSQKIRLKIENPRKNIELKLPFKELKGNPGQEIDIPVILTNTSSKITNVKLEISGLEEVCVIKNQNSLDLQNLQIRPTTTETLNIRCQIPSEAKPGNYNFTVTDISPNNFYQSNEKDRPSDEGVLEILAHGFIEFECINKVEKIPNLQGDNKNVVSYELEFVNYTNSQEEVDVSLTGEDVDKCKCETDKSISLKPDKDVSDEQKQSIEIKVIKKRPFFGWERQYKLLVSPKLKSDNNVAIKPNSENLTLNVSPRIPFLFQILGLISIPLLILLLNYYRVPRKHNAPVTSVSLIGIAGTVISASSDRTIRRWQVNDDFFRNQSNLKYEGILSSDDTNKSKIEKAIRVIKFRPKTRDEDQVAVGLENGEIQLWDLSSSFGNPKRTYLKTGDEKNRVFDLEFTKDSQSLIAGYGSGAIREWDLDKLNSNDFKSSIPKNETKAGFTISTLGISEKPKLYNFTLVVVGGRFNRLAFWDWQNKNRSESEGDNKNEDENPINIYHLPYDNSDGDNNRSFKQIIGKESYITSLVIAEEKELLITADNKGILKLWDLNKIRECIVTHRGYGNNEEYQKLGFIPLNCTRKKVLLDEIAFNKNFTEQETQIFPSIRSIAITEDESYLASAGDDGYVRIWKIKDEGTNEKELICLHQKSTDAKLNTIDIKFKNNQDKQKKELLIATGDDKFRVMLHSIKNNLNKKTEKDANCK